jgi:hypothetical protein
MKTNKPIMMLVLGLLVSCSKDKGSKGDKGDPGTSATSGKASGEEGPGPNNGGFESHNTGPNDGGGNPGGPGSLALAPSVDVQGAFGLMSMDNQGGAALALMEQHNDTIDKFNLGTAKFNLGTDDEFNLLGVDEYYLFGKQFRFFQPLVSFSMAAGKSDADGLQKLDASGAVTSAISTKCVSGTTQAKETTGTGSKDQQPQQPCQELPQIRTIAQATTGELYFHFDRPFVYRVPTEQNADVWDQKNGYQCQIFKVKGGTVDQLIASPAGADNLECIDNLHFIDQWRAGANGVFQFDGGGNVYYPGSIPGGGKMVLYKRTHDGSATTEVINSNICVKDYLITPAGGTFYTGSTCSDEAGGGSGGSGGFFRYVAPGANGQVIEIARNWWNFIYDTRVDSNGAVSTDKAVFFGPDPRSTGTAGWDSACLFEFDPSKSTPSERVSDVITCGNDIWGWMELRRPADRALDTNYYSANGMHPVFNPNAAWKKEYQRRCESKDQVFAGGGSQIQAIKQNNDGEIYVVGNIQKKVEGKLSCRIEVRGPHCVVDKVAKLSLTTTADCATANGTWVDKGNCSNGTSGSSCLNHDRKWRTGTCSSDGLLNTEAACTVGVWDTGVCSNRDHLSQATCTGGEYWTSFAGHCSDPTKLTKGTCTSGATWVYQDWEGYCASPTLSAAQEAGFFNKRDCQPDFQPETVWYDGVSNDSCVADDAPTKDPVRRDYWYDWNDSRNHASSLADLDPSNVNAAFPKFLINGYSCEQVGTAANGRWTNEYSALAKVDPSTHSLKLISLSSEQAIDLWMVQGKPYYSSFDALDGKYLLNSLDVVGRCIRASSTSSSCSSDGGTWQQRQCMDSTRTTQADCEAVAGLVWSKETPKTILSNFEAYHVARASADKVYADGLDFSDNTYKFGKITLSNGAFTANPGLTGRVNAIVILGN